MSIYEDVKIIDMRFDSDQQMYFYNCPCGDLFEISLEELYDGEDIALCPSCSLKVRVLFEECDLPVLDTTKENVVVDSDRIGNKMSSSIDSISTKTALLELDADDESDQ